MNENSFRNRVTFMSFILCVMVILTHAYNSELFFLSDNSYSGAKLELILGEKICQMATSGFFMMSSYLFFRNFCLSKTVSKYLRRFQSLLLPYFLWNIIYYLGYVLATRIPGLTKIVGRGVIVFDVKTFLHAALFYTYNPVFWYVFQLIILVVLSPFIYIVVKRYVTAIIMLLAVAVLIFFNINIPYLNADALFYYTSAAFFAIHMTKVVEKRGFILSFLSGFLCICLAVMLHELTVFPANTLRIVLSRTLAPMGVWLILKAIPLPLAPRFMKNSFLIYSTHFALVRLINKAAAHFFPGNALLAVGLYLLMPIIIVFTVSHFAGLLRNHIPLLYKALSGNR